METRASTYEFWRGGYKHIFHNNGHLIPVLMSFLFCVGCPVLRVSMTGPDWRQHGKDLTTSACWGPTRSPELYSLALMSTIWLKKMTFMRKGQRNKNCVAEREDGGDLTIFNMGEDVIYRILNSHSLLLFETSREKIGLSYNTGGI